MALKADVTQEQVFVKLAETMIERTGRLFDIVALDPPWDGTGTIKKKQGEQVYGLMSDNAINAIPIEIIQKVGFCFIWYTNAKLENALKFLIDHGYR